ncbi:MAG: hypothetical protein ACTHZ1_09200 [Sphingobacterium sp.]
MILAEKIRLLNMHPQKDFFDNQFDSGQKEIKLAVAQSTKHNIEIKSFKITLSVLLECDDKIIAEYIYDFFFEVENILDFLTDEGKQIFSGNLIGTLLSISYSTLRGITYVKLSDTNLKGFILPVINPNDLLKSKITE